MKTQRISGTPEKLEQLLEEYLMLGYFAEMDGEELVVYYGQPQKKSKKKNNKQGQKDERWSKRERNFGYTRG